MAQSRLEKIGTIYSRYMGLLKSGAVSEASKPLWVDLYEAFPPKFEPRWDRKIGHDKPERKILYKEDVIRAQFYKQFEGKYETHDLFDNDTPSLSQIFIDKYRELEASGKIPKEELFRATVDKLEVEDGINLREVATENQKVMKEYAATEKAPPQRKRMLIGNETLKELFLEAEEEAEASKDTKPPSFSS